MKILKISALFLLIAVEGQLCSDGEEVFKGVKPKLEKILEKNILPFWYPKVIDDKRGGYRLNHDKEGQWQGPSEKCLVTQARTVWFFSRLCRTPYGKPELRKAAEHGYKFLRDSLWDKQSGGFFWAVESNGKTPAQTEKHLYGQAFGLYALSEFARTFKNREARKYAEKLFNLLESHAHDKRHGGYKEAFQRDWTALPSQSKTRLGVSPNVKLMNTHLHLMEALTTYYRLTGASLARRRLVELILIQSNAVVRKDLGACTDQYAEDWTPLHGPSRDRVSYGHDIENVWLLKEACEAAGIPAYPLYDLWHTLFEYSLKYGFDHKQGGFYYTGSFRKAAENRSKEWWVQAEGLVSSLMMYSLSRRPVYRECFLKTFQWIYKRQVDWENGDWFARIGPDGSTGGVKAGPWKSPYHNGRAVIRCLELLAEAAE